MANICSTEPLDESAASFSLNFLDLYSATSLALDSLSTTLAVSPAIGVPDSPKTSIGVEGSANFTFSPISFINALTFPLSEPTTIVNYVSDFLISPQEPQINTEVSSQLLFGKKAVVTSGPTHEAIDPVRYVTNHSSGQQGHAIAQALSKHGAETVLVSGPTNLPNPHNIKVVNVKTAIQMLDACEKEMPADVVVCAAAVTDWRIEAPSKQKLKKSEKVKSLKLSENPDILAHLGQKRKNRPPLVIGFAAETENVEKNAKKKLFEKSCDWIVANNVGADTNTFGGDKNKVQLINKTKTESWPEMSKVDVGNRLAIKVAEHLSDLKP